MFVSCGLEFRSLDIADIDLIPRPVSVIVHNPSLSLWRKHSLIGRRLVPALVAGIIYPSLCLLIGVKFDGFIRDGRTCELTAFLLL